MVLSYCISVCSKPHSKYVIPYLNFYLSNNPAADRQDRRREKRQKGIHFQDHAGGARRSERGCVYFLPYTSNLSKVTMKPQTLF